MAVRPEQVLKYLARYTHRVAITKARLRSVADGKITFRFKDFRSSAPLPEAGEVGGDQARLEG